MLKSVIASPDMQPWLLYQIQLKKKKKEPNIKNIHIGFAQHGPFFNIMSTTHSLDVSPFMIKYVPTIFQKESYFI